MWLSVAQSVSVMSHCTRKKVGCIVVKNGQIVSQGWNGTPTGTDNCCEDSANTTHPHVIHAELNAIKKLLDTNPEALEGSVIYLTLQPCVDCATLIIRCKISEVHYISEYRDASGLNLLLAANTPVFHHP
jgi:dCMP deaminase